MLRTKMILPFLIGAFMMNGHAEDLEIIEVENVTERIEDQVITQEDLRKLSPTDMRGLFEKAQSLSVGGGTATSQKLYLRGVEDINLNVQVDGARQGGYLFHHQGNLFIEPELVKSIEVRPGIARADDGFGIMGGSVLVKTKNAFDFASPDHRQGGIVKGTYYSNERYLRPTLGLFSMPTDKLGVLALGTYKDGNSYVNGEGDTIRGTADHQLSGLLKVSGRGERFSYDLGHERFEDEGIRAPRQNFGHSDSDVAARQESRRDTLTFNGIYSVDPRLLNFETNLYHTHSKLRRERENLSDSRAHATAVGGSFSNTVELQNNRTKLGADFIRSATNAAQGEEKERNTGIFVQNRLKFIRKMNIDFGARFDEHLFTTASDKTFSNSAVSPNIRGEYCFSGACLFTGYSESFRGIKPGEAVLITGTINYPDDLRPETSIAREIGASVVKNKHQGKLVFFQTDIQDFIVHNRPTNTRDNNGLLSTDGYEASYFYSNPSVVSGKLSYTQVRPTFQGSEILNQNMGMGTSLGDTWVISLNRQWEKYRLLYGANFKYVEKVNTSSIDKPGYQTYDLWLDWTPSKEQDLKLSLYISNLFNKNYVDHGTFVSTGREPLWAPGRDVRLTASYAF